MIGPSHRYDFVSSALTEVVSFALAQWEAVQAAENSGSEDE